MPNVYNVYNANVYIYLFDNVQGQQNVEMNYRNVQPQLKLDTARTLRGFKTVLLLVDTVRS